MSKIIDVLVRKGYIQPDEKDFWRIVLEIVFTGVAIITAMFAVAAVLYVG